MEVRIKQIDKRLPLPAYGTLGAAAFDLFCRVTTEIAPGATGLVASNVVVCVPDGYVLLLSSRSSTARKKGLIVPLGVIDPDYCGPDDELFLQVVNFTDKPVTVERGDRIGQGLFFKAEHADWQEVTELDAKNRGGFGTTG
jgi:dUTP pyrophosphatase